MAIFCLHRLTDENCLTCKKSSVQVQYRPPFQSSYFGEKCRSRRARCGVFRQCRVLLFGGDAVQPDLAMELLVSVPHLSCWVLTGIGRANRLRARALNYFMVHSVGHCGVQPQQFRFLRGGRDDSTALDTRPEHSNLRFKRLHPRGVSGTHPPRHQGHQRIKYVEAAGIEAATLDFVRRMRSDFAAR